MLVHVGLLATCAKRPSALEQDRWSGPRVQLKRLRDRTGRNSGSSSAVEHLTTPGMSTQLRRTMTLRFAPFLARSLSVVPRDALTFRFARSSGPGGQHVNKVNTKVDARFVLNDATWLTEHEKQAIAEKNSGRVNGRGELYVTSQRHRSQAANKEDCVRKLQDIVDAAQIQAPLPHAVAALPGVRHDAGLIFSSDKTCSAPSQDSAGVRQGRSRKSTRQGRSRKKVVADKSARQADDVQQQRQKRGAPAKIGKPTRVKKGKQTMWRWQ